MKILIIEDDPNINEALSLILKISLPEARMTFSCFGEEGIEMLLSDEPDIVVLDLGLPDISGFDVLKRIRSFSSIPVLVLTARTEKADMEKAFELGANYYMTKPFRQPELVEKLKYLTAEYSVKKNWNYLNIY